MTRTMRYGDFIDEYGSKHTLCAWQQFDRNGKEIRNEYMGDMVHTPTDNVARSLARTLVEIDTERKTIKFLEREFDGFNINGVATKEEVDKGIKIWANNKYPFAGLKWLVGIVLIAIASLMFI